MDTEAAESLLDRLSEPWPADGVARIDRYRPAHDTTPAADAFARDGYLIVPGLLPDDLIDAYKAEWVQVHGDPAGPGREGWTRDGWTDPTPYMRHRALRDLATCAPVQAVMQELFAEPMGLHLNLTGWVSTQRDWHQDGYLNPDSNRDWYCAAWMALDDIHPDAGPFEYVPGSHRAFPPIRHKAMLAALEPEEANSPGWPTYSERLLTPMFDRLMADRGMEPEQFLAKRGDVLFWHARLLHRGSKPNNPDLTRCAVINHYSGIHHRPDMPPVTYPDTPGAGPYFDFG